MKYFKNTSWLLAERLLRMVVGLVVGVWVARYLGPEQYGLLSYALSFVGLFMAFSTLGLDAIVIRRLVKEETVRGRLLGTTFILKSVGALFVFILLAGAVALTSNDALTNQLVFIIAGMMIFHAFNVFDFYFQSEVLSKYVVYAHVAGLLLSSCVRIALVLTQAELIYFAFAILLDSIIVAVGLLYYYVAQHHDIRAWCFDGAVAKSLLGESWPLIFSGMVLMVQSRIDQVMLKEMVGSAEVGYYSVALRLIETFGFVPMILKSSLFPSIVKSKENSLSMYRSRLLNFYRMNFLLFLVAAIPIFLLAEFIVVTLYGEAYRTAGFLLSLMAIRLFFTNMGVARSVFVVTEHLQRFSLVSMVAGTIVNVALNYLWIPVYGAQGAIVATIASFTVTTFALDLFYHKSRPNVWMQLRAIGTFYRLRLGEIDDEHARV